MSGHDDAARAAAHACCAPTHVLASASTSRGGRRACFAWSRERSRMVACVWGGPAVANELSVNCASRSACTGSVRCWWTSNAKAAACSARYVAAWGGIMVRSSQPSSDSTDASTAAFLAWEQAAAKISSRDCRVVVVELIDAEYAAAAPDTQTVRASRCPWPHRFADPCTQRTRCGTWIQHRRKQQLCSTHW